MKTSYHPFSTESFQKRVAALKETRNQIANVDELHVYISVGNVKMGAIPSISLLPVLDCGNCKACKLACYDLRHDVIYKTVQNTRARNSAIYAANPQRYFSEVDAWLTMQQPKGFRWHVGGDIKDAGYFRNMVAIAEKHPNTQFIAFTKMFQLVNEYLDGGNKIPDNLNVLFSCWVGQEIDNPYNLPTTHPIFPDGTTTAGDGAQLCTGNCTECLQEKRLCWHAKTGDQIVFIAH